jgi:hypothetical protein
MAAAAAVVAAAAAAAVDAGKLDASRIVEGTRRSNASGALLI